MLEKLDNRTASIMKRSKMVLPHIVPRTTNRSASKLEQNSEDEDDGYTNHFDSLMSMDVAGKSITSLDKYREYKQRRTLDQSS